MIVPESHLYILLILGFHFVLSISFSFLTNWLLLRFARTLGVRNGNEEQERWAATIKPSLGGISFYIVFLVSLAALGLFPFETYGGMDKKLIGIMTASSLGFLLGLADDAYNTNPLVKFIGQMTCAFILITTGVIIPLTNLPQFDFIITVFWVIGLMNSINMLDNMDAITSSISGVIVIGAIILIGVAGTIYNPLLLLLIGVLGSLLGFLYFNWHPAKMYMGDTGSQFLGVFLAGVSIILFWDEGFKDPQSHGFQLRLFVVPALMFIVPLIDTTTVTIRRLLRRQSPFVGGKDHTTHHLAYMGFSDRWVAIILICINALSIPVLSLVWFDVIEWNSFFTLFAVIYFISWFTIIQIIYSVAWKRHKARQKSQGDA